MHCLYVFIIAVTLVIQNQVCSATQLISGDLTPITTTGNDSYPSVVYNSNQSDYMMAYEHEVEMRHQIHVQRLDTKGNTVGPPTHLTDLASSERRNSVISHDSVNNQYLVAWADWDYGIANIHTHLVSHDGKILLGEETFVALEDQINPDIAFSPVSQKYLIVYEERAPTGDSATSYIKGAIISADNQIIHNFTVSSRGIFLNEPKVTYNAKNNIFIVIFADGDSSNSTTTDLYARIVSPDGTLHGDRYSVSTAPSRKSRPEIASHPTLGHSMIIWQDDRNDPADEDNIYGQMMADSGMLLGNEFIISDGPKIQRHPNLAYNAEMENFLVVWDDRRQWPNQFRGRFYSNTGEPEGNDINLTPYGESFIHYPVVAASQDRSFLLSYNFYDSLTYCIGRKLVTQQEGNIFMFVPAIVDGAKRRN